MIKKAISSGLFLTAILAILLDYLAPGLISNWLPVSVFVLALLFLSVVFSAYSETEHSSRSLILIVLITLFFALFVMLWEDLGLYGVLALILATSVIVKLNFLDGK